MVSRTEELLLFHKSISFSCLVTVAEGCATLGQKPVY